MRDEFSEDHGHIIGECTAMCPKAEILIREKTKRLSVFEIEAGTENDKIPRALHHICVKEYTRSGAGCRIDPSTLRPAHVLVKCMDYLVDEIVDQDKHGKSWVDIYDFVSDRVRAIKHDLLVQRIQNDVAIDILKKAVRFHIVIMEECKSERNFDRAACLDQLHGCLLPLMAHARAVETVSIADEFRLYYILLNMKSKDIVLNSIRNILQENMHVKNGNYKQATVDLALEFVIFNYYKLFRIFERLPYIASCCLVMILDSLRIKSLTIIQKAYSSKNSKLPLQALTKWLRFDSCQDAREFCELVGLNSDNQSILMNRTLQSDTGEIEKLKSRSNWRLIGIKKFKTIKDYVREGDKF